MVKYNRILRLEDELDMSLFLFGARKTGKSTLLCSDFPNAIYIDLLDNEILRLYKERPSRLYEQL